MVARGGFSDGKNWHRHITAALCSGRCAPPRPDGNLVLPTPRETHHPLSKVHKAANR